MDDEDDIDGLEDDIRPCGKCLLIAVLMSLLMWRGVIYIASLLGL